MARRWCLVCVLALSACSQSLFDSSTGDGRDGGPGGGGDGGGEGDGSIPVSDCPEPCAGDAAADFATEQGAGVWYYLHDLGSANGADYDEMAFGTWSGIDAWSTTDTGPAIANCTGQSDDACAGLDGFVLLVPGPGNARPALAFRAPETATYSISGAARIADGGPTDVPMQLLISRAGRHDAIALQAVRTSETETGISGLVPAVEGDEIKLSIGSDDPEIPPLGVRLYFTRVDSGGDAFPGSCQVAIRFDADAPLAEDCNGIEITDLTDGIAEPDPGPSSNGPGPSARLGEARQLVEGQYLRVGGAPLDYSGEFTIQFWAKVVDPPFGPGLYNDWNTAVKGGVAFFTDYDSNIVDFCYMAHGAEEIETCDQTSLARDQAWHFWRAVRQGGSYTLCIDGVEKVSAPIAAGLNMTSDEAPRLGRNVVYNPAYFDGSIDEVRVFSEPLPCSTVP